MLQERERFEGLLHEYDNKVRAQEELIRIAKNEIFKIRQNQTTFRHSCKHCLDNGESAFKDSSYWVSDISYHENSFTGEEEEYDSGYTEYEETCEICGHEREK